MCYGFKEEYHSRTVPAHAAHGPGLPVMMALAEETAFPYQRSKGRTI